MSSPRLYPTPHPPMRDIVKVGLVIGLLSELTITYKFKFFWTPFLDQYDPPLIGRVFGRRRSWLIVAILAVIAMLTGITFGDPRYWIWWTVGFSIAGATLDLVLDGWCIPQLRKEPPSVVFLSVRGP